MRPALVPSIVLVAVAVSQLVLAKTMHLTAWKGGGFGMFSTLDHGAYRGVDIVVEAPDRSEGLEIPPSLEVLVARSAALPSDWLLATLAEGVVNRERRYERPVSKVILTVWRTDFARASLAANQRTIRTFVYNVP